MLRQFVFILIATPIIWVLLEPPIDIVTEYMSTNAPTLPNCTHGIKIIYPPLENWEVVPQGSGDLGKLIFTRNPLDSLWEHREVDQTWEKYSRTRVNLYADYLTQMSAGLIVDYSELSNATDAIGRYLWGRPQTECIKNVFLNTVGDIGNRDELCDILRYIWLEDKWGKC
jgi:hypothetical protein